MSRVNRTFEIANFVITFENEGLVANFNTRFWPAIRDGVVKGKGEVRSYRFINLEVKSLNHNNVDVPVLCGRLVKLMTIEAEQIFDEGKESVVSTQDSIPSAPSAFFVVELINHKICFLRETRRAPSIKDLEYCLRKILMQDYYKQRSEMKKSIKDELGKQRLVGETRLMVNTMLDSSIPKPDVRITAIPGKGDLEERLNKYRTIETISISPLKTNNELSDENAKFLRAYQEQSEKISSQSGKVELRNTKTGLDIEESKTLLKDASDGNFKVKVSGVTNSGQKIQGDDLEKYGLKFTEAIPTKESNTDRAIRTFSKLMHALSDGLITLSTTTDEIREKAIELVKGKQTDE